MRERQRRSSGQDGGLFISKGQKAHTIECITYIADTTLCSGPPILVSPELLVPPSCIEEVFDGHMAIASAVHRYKVYSVHLLNYSF